MTPSRGSTRITSPVDLAVLLVSSGLVERLDSSIDLDQLRVDEVDEFAGGVTPPPGPLPLTAAGPDLPSYVAWMQTYLAWTITTLEERAAAELRLTNVIGTLAAMAEQAVAELAAATGQDGSSWLAQWRAVRPQNHADQAAPPR